MATSPSARTTNELIKQVPGNSVQFANMLKRLGLWTTRAHDQIDERRQFVSNLAAISPDQLAEEQSYWSSEAGRITELHGFLQAQSLQADLNVKHAQATARSNVRQQNASKVDAAGKPIKLTAGEVGDLAEQQTILKDAREQAVFVESALVAVAATKEATFLYLNTLSREITRRGDLMKASL